MKTQRQRRRRTTPSERAQILNDFQSSGMSHREYAAKHGIGYSTFFGWVRDRKRAGTSSEVENNSAFVEIEQATVTTGGKSSAAPAFVVRLSEKVGVEFFAGYAAGDLHAVLAIAQAVERA